MSVLIRNAVILTQNQKRQQISGDIFVEDEVIQQISEKPITV